MNTIHSRNVRIEGLNGSGAVAFEGDISHGNGRRTVRLHVEPETIFRIAAELLTAGYTTDLEGGVEHRRWACGHAIYHHGRVDDTPCGSCVPVPGTEETIRVLRELAAKGTVR